MIFHQPGNSRSNYSYNGYMYANMGFAPHFHSNSELLIPIRAAVSVTVEGRQYLVEPGQMALVLPNQIHSFAAQGDALLWVGVFSYDYVPELSPAVKGRQGVSIVFTPGDEVYAMAQRYLITGRASLLMRKACLGAVCDEFLSQVTLQTRQEKSSSTVARLLDWVSENYTWDITLKQAAEHLGYEYHYLSRLLNTGYRIGFTQLLNSYRVEHARRLLETTALPVAQVAVESGFQSLRSFNQVFRDMTGTTPRSCRGLTKSG